MIEDFERIEGTVNDRVLDLVDHQNLNEFIENPTVENIVLWIWKKLDGALLQLDELVLWETSTACAVLRRQDIGHPSVPSLRKGAARSAKAKGRR